MCQDEWNIHNRIDSKLESVKVKLVNLVRKLEEPLKISSQNRRDSRAFQKYNFVDD